MNHSLSLFQEWRVCNSLERHLSSQRLHLFGQTRFAGESVKGIVRLSHSSDSSTDGEGLKWNDNICYTYNRIGSKFMMCPYLVGGEHTASGWVNITEVDLDWWLVFGTDQAVRSWAFSWDVKIDNFSLIVLHFFNPNFLKKSTILP